MPPKKNAKNAPKVRSAQTQAVRSGNAKAAKRIKAARKNVRRRALDPLVHCVYGPVGMAGGSTGVPDGSSYKTVTMEHRSTVVFTPDKNGAISFAVISNPYGAVAYRAGVVSHRTIRVEWLAGAATGDVVHPHLPVWIGNADVTHTYVGQTGLFAPNYAIIPFKEWAFDGRNGDGLNVLDGPFNQNGLRIQRWRTITTTGRILYGGDDFNNSGLMAIARSPLQVGTRYDVKTELRVDSSAEALVQMTDVVAGQFSADVPQGFSAVSTMVGATLTPVRCGADIICPPANFKWHEWEDAFYPVANTFQPVTIATGAPDTAPMSMDDLDQAAYSLSAVPSGSSWSYPIQFAGAGVSQFTSIAVQADPAQGTEALTALPIPGWSDNDVTFVEIQGMKQAQPIVVETRTCCEYELAYNSPTASFARNAPRPRPAAINSVLDIARVVPSSKPPSDDKPWIAGLLEGVGKFMSSEVGQIAKGLGRLALTSFVPAPLLALTN